VTGPWFSRGTPISSTNETDRRNIIEILLKEALNTITLVPSVKYIKVVLFTLTKEDGLYKPARQTHIDFVCP
jgi:hypothetical protein